MRNYGTILNWGLLYQPESHVIPYCNGSKSARTSRANVQVLFRPTVAHNSSNSLRWSKSSRGRAKCNVDATIFTKQGRYGVGMCLRGDKGDFIASKISWFHGLPQPQEAEA
ncbi:60S ribosomal protein L23, partial [Trifolium medium]|nr:60S ribosomal protein L23 [Trifolium medium]